MDGRVGRRFELGLAGGFQLFLDCTGAGGECTAAGSGHAFEQHSFEQQRRTTVEIRKRARLCRGKTKLKLDSLRKSRLFRLRHWCSRGSCLSRRRFSSIVWGFGTRARRRRGAERCLGYWPALAEAAMCCSSAISTATQNGAG